MKRLTDSELRLWGDTASLMADMFPVPIRADALTALVTELRSRRAADGKTMPALSEDERTALDDLRFELARVTGLGNIELSELTATIATLDRLAKGE